MTSRILTKIKRRRKMLRYQILRPRKKKRKTSLRKTKNKSKKKKSQSRRNLK
jgi:hypothetical protein